MAVEKVSTSATDTEIPVGSIQKTKSNNIYSGLLKDKKVLVGILLLFILIAIGILSVFIKGRATPNPIATQASSDVQKGNYQAAQSILRPAIKQDPKNPQLLSSMINAISLKGNQTGSEAAALTESQQYINAALSSNPNDLGVLISAGYAYEIAGDYQKAFDYYDKAVKSFPKSSDAYFHRGHALQFLNKNDEAYSDYNKSLSLDPNNPAALMVIGNKLLSDGKTEEAFQDYEKASQIPNQSSQSKSEALTAAASVRTSQDNYIHFDEALTLSKNAFDTDPSFSPALAIYGYDLYLSKRKTEGIEYLEKAIAANSRISKNYYILSLLQRESKDFGNSINNNKVAISKVDNDNTLVTPQLRQSAHAKYTYELARTYQAAGISTDLLPIISTAINEDPSLKTNLNQDVTVNGFFASLASNPDFQVLLK